MMATISSSSSSSTPAHGAQQAAWPGLTHATYDDTTAGMEAEPYLGPGPDFRSDGDSRSVRIRHTYFIARGIPDADPRRQLANAFRSQSPNVTYVRCTHVAPVPPAAAPPVRRDHPPPAALPGLTALPCTCRACHAKVWKHIHRQRAGIPPLARGTWYLVVDLGTISVQDTFAIRPWLATVPLDQVAAASGTMVLLNDRSSTYLVGQDGVVGLSMVHKGRHPDDYNRYLRPVVISQTPLSLVAILLDVLGFEDLVTMLTTSLIRINVTQHYTLDLNYFHVIAVVVFVVNQMYTRLFVVDVLVSVELLMLLLLGG